MPNSSVPPSIPRAGTAAVETSETVVEEIEDVFLPRPDGMVARHRAERARREAAERSREQACEPVEERAYKAIKVVQVQPEVTSANTITIQPGAIGQVLPLSPYRAMAHVTVVTTEASVILAKDSSQALGGIGFPLTTGQILPVLSRAQLYAYNPGYNTVQVSVIAELYAPEGS